MKNVNIFQRGAAFLLDGIIGISISLVTIIAIFAEPPYFTLSNVVIFNSVLVTYILIDHFFVLHNTGFTVSRWFCGYKIRSKATKSNPSYLQCIKRYFTLFLLEIGLLFSAISLVTILFRKDKAAIHDLTSNTEVVRVQSTVTSITTKAATVIVITVASMIFFSPSIATILDRVFIQPSSKYSNNKNVVNPIEIDTNKTFYSLHGIPIVAKSSESTLSVQTTDKLYSDSKTFLLKIDDLEIIFDISELPSKEILRHKWLSESVNFNDVAYNAFSKTQKKYKTLHPFDNYATFLIRLLSASFDHPESTQFLFSTNNEKCFTKFYRLKNKKMSYGIFIELYDKNSLDFISIKPKQLISLKKPQLYKAYNKFFQSIIDNGRISSCETNEHVKNNIKHIK